MLTVAGDTSHLALPGQHIFIKRIVIFGGPNDGNVMLLDIDGSTSVKDAKAREVSIGKDPRIVAEGLVAADSRTEVLFGYKVRGLFLDDIPDGGKVEVYHGSE